MFNYIPEHLKKNILFDFDIFHLYFETLYELTEYVYSLLLHQSKEDL